MTLGFFFNNKHSGEFDIAMETAVRGLLPSLRRNDYEITGRHGTVDYGNETYNTRQITVNICFIEKDVEALQLKARNTAHWLSGKGILIFDDELDKAYNARVYEAVSSTEQLIRAKRASVTFECQPFATSINYLQSINTGVSSGKEMQVISRGSQPTPCIIIIKNTGGVNISNIIITRKAVNR